MTWWCAVRWPKRRHKNQIKWIKLVVYEIEKRIKKNCKMRNERVKKSKTKINNNIAKVFHWTTNTTSSLLLLITNFALATWKLNIFYSPFSLCLLFKIKQKILYKKKRIFIQKRSEFLYKKSFLNDNNTFMLCFTLIQFIFKMSLCFVRKKVSNFETQLSIKF